MATDTNQTIRDSRKAAMSILNSAKAKDGQRGPQNTVPQVDKTAVRRKPNPVDDFLKAGKRKEAADELEALNAEIKELQGQKAAQLWAMESILSLPPKESPSGKKAL